MFYRDERLHKERFDEIRRLILLSARHKPNNEQLQSILLNLNAIKKKYYSLFFGASIRHKLQLAVA